MKIKRSYVELSEYLFYSAPSFQAAEEAPQTYRELAQYRGEKLVVWNGASDRTIYAHRDVNYAFRAIHDMTHLELNAPFDTHGEYRVARRCLDNARAAGLSTDALKALYFDSFGQFAYFRRYGQFIEDQEGFVTHCMEVSHV